MITRDRFEKIMDAIASGTAISNARNRFELICSAIATAIGNAGGGGSTVTRTTLGEYDVTQTQSSVTTLDMSGYDYLEITFAMNDTYGSATKYDWCCTNIYNYSADGRFYAPIFATVSASPTYKTVLAHFGSATTIVLDSGPNNSLNIKKVVGVKIESGE